MVYAIEELSQINIVRDSAKSRKKALEIQFLRQICYK